MLHIKTQSPITHYILVYLYIIVLHLFCDELCTVLLQVKQAMSSSQSVAVSVPNPISATSLPPSSSSSSVDSSGKPPSSEASSQQQQQPQGSEQQSKTQQLSSAALKQVKLTTMKHPPGIDPMAIMKERETRYGLERVCGCVCVPVCVCMCAFVCCMWVCVLCACV